MSKDTWTFVMYSVELFAYIVLMVMVRDVDGFSSAVAVVKMRPT